MQRLSLLSALCLLVAATVLAQEDELAQEKVPEMPMPVVLENTATSRWLKKEVLRSRVLDDMESLDRWKTSFWNQGKGDIRLTDERSIDGKHSLRLRSQTAGERPSPDGGVYGLTAAVRALDEEDWREYNRLSFWVYPSLPGFHAVALTVRLGNRGEQPARDTHHFLLENHRWNRVVWEIPDLARDRVTEVAFGYVMNGKEPGAADVATFDVDHLELQLVEADHFEGWNVAPGRIAFSHTGYPTGAPKTAVASGLAAEQFELISQATGQPVLRSPVKTVDTRLGRFLVMDFTQWTTPGTYTIRAGQVETSPFRIDDHVWERTIWKAINFFYVERCGAAIPGVHGVCHADWQGEHDGRRMVINGGWHDAGDLSQGLVNTSEAVYAMFALAEQLGRRNEHPELRRRLFEEAKWGLDWVMKTSFRNGYRIDWATMRFWTNGVLGDRDDVVAKARRSPSDGFYAAAAEAIAARVLKETEPKLAERTLAMAEEDWRFAVEGLRDRRPEQIDVELASIGVLASVELHKATAGEPYAGRARALGRVIVESQQKDLLAGVEMPLTGFFYRTPQRKQPLSYLHRGHEQAPIVAMAELCEAFPQHEDWMDWYAVVALHSQYYQKAMSALTAPYRMLPNSIRREDESGNPDVREQILNGFELGGGYRVRVYPVQPQNTFRGNYGTLLSQTKAVAVAARLRNDPSLSDLCQEQLYWIVGRNPFAQSAMYGEGYDYAAQYTARSGDIVGSLPVGMKSLGNRDLPYWPATNVWNYKEVWVHPVSRWIWLMCDLVGPAMVQGRVAQGSNETVRPEKALELRLAHQTQPDGRVTISLAATGRGNHTLAMRTFNLDVVRPRDVVSLEIDGSRQVQWECKLRSPGRPWIAVIIPDGDLRQRIEAIDVTGP